MERSPWPINATEPAELVIVDLPSKSIDFLWVQAVLPPGRMGLRFARGSVTALALVYEEGQRRAKVLADAAW